MSNNDDIAGVADYGRPPSNKRTLVFNFHDFEHLTDEGHETPAIFCHGLHWILKIYPNGREVGAKGYISVFLYCLEAIQETVESVRAKFAVRPAGHELFTTAISTQTYSKEPNSGWGALKCWPRDQAIRTLCDSRGTLKLEVLLEVYSDEVKCWKPGKSLGTQVARLYESKKDSDAIFVVGGRRFAVHRLILGLKSPTLAGMFENDAVDHTEVEIENTDPNLFEMMIRFLYTEELPSGFNDESDALELLKLADKFGCSDLKMLLEARVVESPKLFCTQRAADLFLLADAKNCALLRERSLVLIVNSIQEVMITEGWKNILASKTLVSEIILAQSDRSKAKTADVLESASVSVLRKRAFDKGLEADGSRRDLIKRLKVEEDANEESE